MPVKSTTTTKSLASNVVLTPGQKAAATRRANQLHKMYSDRAHKAWATIRAKQASITNTEGEV